jgi:isoquinoline 1-oxidoreductase subunit beta
MKADRRQFLVGSGALTLAIALPAAAQKPGATALAATGPALKPNAWVEVQAQGRVRFICGRTEMGQGSSTGLAMLLCEELELPWQELDLVLAPASRDYDHAQYMLQTTGGSSSVRAEFKTMQQAGASVRELFRNAAAQLWQIKPEQVTLKNGRFVHPANGQSVSYGDLVPHARGLKLPSVAPRDPTTWRLVGTRVPRLDNRPKATGAPIYGIDVAVPDMVCAWVAHAPRAGTQGVVSNEAELLALPGVQQVVITTRGLAIVASKYWQAKAAGAKLQVRWDTKPNTPGAELFSSARDMQQLVQQTQSYAGAGLASSGTLDLTKNAIEAVYELPLLAHATLEPQNCTVRLGPSSCEVWVPTQSPGLVVPVVKQLTGLAADQIKVHCTYLGGGFGRRLEADFVVEAVEIARAYKGKSAVKMLWDRETDMQAGMYRPAAVARIRGRYDKNTQQLRWEETIATPSIMERQGPDFMQGIAPHWVSAGLARGVGTVVAKFIDDLTVKEGAAPPYRTAGLKVNWQKTQTPVPVASWRSVGHSHNAFFVECFADELAHSQQQDPLAFRLQMLGADQPRLRATLQAVTQACNWSAGPAKDRFRGLACHESFKGFAAMVVEVSVDNAGAVRVHEVWCAIDCGRPVNPDGITQQLEGSVIFGLSAALYGEITLEQGQVQQSNFHDYPLLRNEDAPRITSIIVPSTELPGGVGEPAVPLVAPALANAIFAATGVRRRKLPLSTTTSARA